MLPAGTQCGARDHAHNADCPAEKSLCHCHVRTRTVKRRLICKSGNDPNPTRPLPRTNLPSLQGVRLPQAPADFIGQSRPRFRGAALVVIGSTPSPRWIVRRGRRAPCPAATRRNRPRPNQTSNAADSVFAGFELHAAALLRDIGQERRHARIVGRQVLTFERVADAPVDHLPHVRNLA